MARKKTIVKREKVKPLKKKRELSEEAREKMRTRLAAMRAKKKPADYKNVAKSVLALPDDDKYSFKNVKKWIKHSKDLVLEYNKIARSRVSSSQEAQKASNAADHKKVYIRELEYYLNSGDFISYFSGQDEATKVIPRCVSMAYYDGGTPKRSVGVFYPDINTVWTRDMDETMFEIGEMTQIMFLRNLELWP
ncbi:hypothetical protein HX858_08590 [Marine Group I thaumarchaeote]|uniref:Uncharacterized protein n=1 Tax=Marine Group I thaumarchaeote TaxID=2511932 RepID=A0A7K4MY84_9ARCH|nr:hypothetical protein [Marine Group I thaumarchaeote]